MDHTDAIYTLAMNLANKLRLVGKHDDAHQIEVWALALIKQLRSNHED